MLQESNDEWIDYIHLAWEELPILIQEKLKSNPELQKAWEDAHGISQAYRVLNRTQVPDLVEKRLHTFLGEKLFHQLAAIRVEPEKAGKRAWAIFCKIKAFFQPNFSTSALMWQRWIPLGAGAVVLLVLWFRHPWPQEPILISPARPQGTSEHYGYPPSGRVGFKDSNPEIIFTQTLVDGAEEGSSVVTRSFQERQKMLMERDADDLLMLARRLKLAGRWADALQKLEVIQRFYPEYTFLSDAYFYQAQAQVGLGQISQALDNLKIISNRFPEKRPLVFSLVRQLQKMRPDLPIDIKDFQFDAEIPANPMLHRE
jgi:tetratricopeptide (TPR) repeat protein